MASSEEPKKKEKLPFLKKAEREACWKVRDAYWDCFSVSDEVQELCMSQRKAFVAACPKTWVGHFDRRFHYDKFKASMNESGWEKLDAEFEKNGKRKVPTT